MNKIEDRICCLNCHFFLQSRNNRGRIITEPLCILSRKALLVRIEGKENKNIEKEYSCNFNIWTFNDKPYDDCEKANTYNLLLKKRTYNECFYMKYEPSRSIEASKILQEREYKRRENQRQWFVTILALFVTVLTAIAGIIFTSFLSNTGIFWKSIVLVAFVVFGYSIFNLLKVRFWDNRI